MAYHTPHCARIQPARLACGLAEAVERRGVTIYEDTPVTEIASGRAGTSRGTVRAPIILRHGGLHPGAARPAPDLVTHEQFDDRHRSDPGRVVVRNRLGRAGNRGGQCPCFFYAQRTVDDRIAIRLLTDVLHTILPQVRDVPIAHGWCGVLGVTRDWQAGVVLDKASGLGWAGGYVGHGVTATNLAGRTLTELPWVGHRSRNWEPEPLRWLGVRGLYVAYRLADRHEASGRARTSPIARVADVITRKPH